MLKLHTQIVCKSHTIKINADSLWRAALALCTFNLSTSHSRSFEEAFTTLKVGTDRVFLAAMALLAGVLAARFQRRPQETITTLVHVAGCLLFAAVLV